MGYKFNQQIAVHKWLTCLALPLVLLHSSLLTGTCVFSHISNGKSCHMKIEFLHMELQLILVIRGPRVLTESVSLY